MRVMYDSLLPVEAKQFWYDVGYMLGICFVDFFVICTYVYGCRYHHDLSYKAPINNMVVMLS